MSSSIFFSRSAIVSLWALRPVTRNYSVARMSRNERRAVSFAQKNLLGHEDRLECWQVVLRVAALINIYNSTSDRTQSHIQILPPLPPLRLPRLPEPAALLVAELLQPAGEDVAAAPQWRLHLHPLRLRSV